MAAKSPSGDSESPRVNQPNRIAMAILSVSAAPQPFCCPRNRDRCPSGAVGQHALAEEPNGLHDLGVWRAARVGVAQPEQTVARPGGVLPAPEFPHARLWIAQDQAIGGEALQGELG